MDKVLAERRLVLEASRERIWSLLGRAILDSLELERFHARDDRNFNALTRVKAAFVTITLQVKGAMVDISPPEALSVLLEAKGMGGIIQLNQKVIITLNSIDGDKTEFICKVVRGGAGSVLVAILTPKAKSFAKEILESIEKRLRQLA